MSTENERNEENVLVLDLQTLLLPVSVIIGAVIIAATIYFSGERTEVAGSKVNIDSGTIVDTAEEPLFALGELVGVDPQELKDCAESGEMEDEIAKDISEASEAGINGTPGFIVGVIKDGKVVGEVVSGAQPFAAFQTVIDKYLAGDGDGTSSIAIGDDATQGDSKAKVALVEFSDFECPYCQSFHGAAYLDIVSEYVDKGNLLYVYKDFPLSFHDPVATEEAVAAECVQELAGDEAYFEFTQAIYENTKSNGAGL